jgi:hypothetical protein
MHVYSDDEMEPARETVADVIKVETSRQTIILLFSVAGSVAAVLVMRAISGPDVIRTLKMRWALRAKRLAEKQVEWWERKRDAAATAYNRERY